tara:strand:+ start:967 stop:1149 length:183 start_codon:yes stop_codon:yes gene_type:complete
MMEYDAWKFIEETLESMLDDERNKLSKMMKDKNCSVEIYEKALDKCKKIEYTIVELEKTK